MGMSILLDACLMTSYVALIIDFGECNPIYGPHSIQVHHCNEDHLGSHPNVFCSLQEGDKYVGLEEFKQAVPLLKAGEPQWEEFYWLRLHVVFFKMQVMRELKNEFIKMI